MGLNIYKGVTRALGIPDPVAAKIAPYVLYTNPVGLSIVGTQALVASASQSRARQAQQIPQNFYQTVPQPQTPYYVQPTGFSDFSQQTFAPANIPDFTTEGAMPWDYSTQFQAFSQPPQPTPAFQTYSGGTQGSLLDSLTTFLPSALALFL